MQRTHTLLLSLYGMIGMAMAASSYPESLISVSRYKLHVLWFLPETSHARLDALLHDGHIGLFELYYNVEALSFSLLVLSAFFGVIWGMKDTSATRLLKIKPLLTLATALFVLYALNALLQRSLDELAEKGFQLDLGMSAMPLYWLVGLVFSAGFTGHYVAQGAHDLAVALRVRMGYYQA
jgi:hypothetical protein